MAEAIETENAEDGAEDKQPETGIEGQGANGPDPIDALKAAHAVAIADMQAKIDAANATALRTSIAVKHGIAIEQAEVLLTGADEATMTKQAEAIQALTKATSPVHGKIQKTPPPGSTGQPGTGSDDAATKPPRSAAAALAALFAN